MATNSSAWITVFVIDQKENISDKAFPAFHPGGKLFLYMKDTFSAQSVPVGYRITDVFYDVQAKEPRQYVHLDKLEGT